MSKNRDTKEEILKSAVKLFSKNNYHTVSMLEIAEGAEVSKGTVYWYFDSKKELFREIIIQGQDYFKEHFKKIAESNKNTEDKICEIIRTVLETLNEHLNLLTVFRNNMELINKEIQNKLEKKHDEIIRIFSEIIKEGMDNGIIKKENPVHISTMILSVLFTPHTQDIIINIDGIDNQVEFIYNFIMNGIRRKEQ
ncbi:MULTISPECIES: TetR/AcrR family transcriptional regulator [unclassified Halanaerobium]|uniref:TetR/AcrR family transcriptional regulator n=1 Tax=unclassified Halanaerobium TaxID=2641197 RepID=UPI000DF3189F|nr:MULTISPECIES: TetR/AcrR family transcriptional regulator [unclassified Halanaerobium]RCW49928.1 TetR family transcriptional regulator [Halanaerobium sp. MA284_MarDTE_T2]RCW79021.1 TetR family transcriptional regulator [Halanaerobium sp. DL-01]